MQTLIPNLVDIHELIVLETSVHRYRDYNMYRINEELQYYEKEIQGVQRQIQYKQKLRTKNERDQQRLIQAKKETERFLRYQRELQQLSELLQQQIENKRQQLHKGLTPARIQQFLQFTADESMVGDRCGVCLDDIEVGRRMMRLDCDGQHVFCKDCVEGWFADHNTCPNCRHEFQ